MQKKETKTPEAAQAEREEIEAIREEIRQQCNKVPAHVLSGFYGVAVSWKSLAESSLRLANSKQPTLSKLRNARDAMRRAASPQ